MPNQPKQLWKDQCHPEDVFQITSIQINMVTECTNCRIIDDFV